MPPGIYREGIFCGKLQLSETYNRISAPMAEELSLNRDRDRILGRGQFWIHDDLFEESFRISYHEEREFLA